MKIVTLSPFIFAALLLWPILSASQSFEPLTNATTANLGAPYLLTDGTVLIQNNFTTGWVKPGGHLSHLRNPVQWAVAGGRLWR